MSNEKTNIDDSKKPVLNEIATVQRDPLFMDYIGRTLLNPDKVLKSEGGGKGIELYEDLLRDPEIRQAMQTRRLAVVGREWEVIPASDDSRDMEIADFVTQALKRCNFDNGRKALLSAIVLGFKVAEVMWEYSEGKIRIQKLIGKPSRRFVFDLDNNLRMLTTQNMIEGEELPQRKFQVFTWGSDNGSPYGNGLGSSLYWLDWFAKNSLKFWLIFADKFGSPTTIGKYPPGTQKEEQEKLLSALEAIQQESAIKIPDTMVIELLEAARQGSVNTYESLCNYLDKKKTKLILGQTLTSEVGDKGSYAASQTHNEVRQEFIKADADELCEAMNGQLIKWLVDYNYPGVTAYPHVWVRTDDEEDLKPLAERDEILQRMGARITHKYIHDTYGIPEPEDGEELVTPSAQGNLNPTLEGGGKGGFDAQQFAEAAVSGLIDTQKDIDALADNSIKESGLDLSQLYKIVDEAESYEDLQQRIAEIYRDIDMLQMNKILAQAMFIADMQGRSLNA